MLELTDKPCAYEHPSNTQASDVDRELVEPLAYTMGRYDGDNKNDHHVNCNQRPAR